jgi:hypothetical protein
MHKDLIARINKTIANPPQKDLPIISFGFQAYLLVSNPGFLSYPRPRDIKKLFSLYDKHYFYNRLSRHINMKFELSNKLTKSAGNIRYKAKLNTVKITFSLPRIFVVDYKNESGYIVNGIKCKTPIEALMRVMEHELTHLIEFILYGDSNCNDARFIQLSYQLWGHTENKHHLGLETPTETTLYGFRKGDKVSFVYQDTIHRGVINRVGKRATVIVDEVRKYYVPLHLLERIL